MKKNPVFYTGPDSDFTDKIREEPMVFSASLEFAKQEGGWLTYAVIKKLEEHFDLSPNTVIDTRVHMLKPGWLPCIGGWHLDAIPRGDDGQPQLDHPAVKNIRHHVLCLDMGTRSTTLFTQGSVPLDLPRRDDENIWATYSKSIQQRIENGWIKEVEAPNGSMVTFDAHQFHKGKVATGDGWRFFFRASENTLTNGPFNEIRRQVQTYIPSEHAGW
jgi:hypothetical protein